MPSAEYDLTELFIRSSKCTGDVPPALVGSSVTYLQGKAYVFGGRALHSGKLSNDIYTCDLRKFVWRRIAFTDDQTDSRPQTAQRHSTTSSTSQQQQQQQQQSEQDQGVPPPVPRFFHSATAFGQHIIVFGGMGLDAEVERQNLQQQQQQRRPPTTTSSSRTPEGGSIQDDHNQHSLQQKTSKILLGDIAVFDTRAERWVAQGALHSGSQGANANGDPADSHQSDIAAAADATNGGVSNPSPRYAHLATLFGSRLLVVGGQDLEEQYVEELNVFDLQTGRWVLRSPFPRAVGLYRSFISSVPDTGRTLLYSNYSFASVRRALYSLSAPPDCTLQEISDAIKGEPPGLRFPRGHLVDPHTILMTGTLISNEGHSELSLWALDTNEMHWRPVNCGAKFRAGSWNQSVIDPRTNTLVIFGDSRRDLTYDYQRRRLNYGEIRTVDLRALGYLRTGSGRLGEDATNTQSASFLAASRAAVMRPATAGGNAMATSPPPSLMQSGKNPADAPFEIGSQLLFFTQFGDSDVIAADGSKAAAVNSGMLRARWPSQAQRWLMSGPGASPSIPASAPSASSPTTTTTTTTDTSAGTSPASRTRATGADAIGSGRRPLGSQTRPDSSLITEEDSGAVHLLQAEGPKRYYIESSREAINMLLFYLYTDRIDVAARFGPHQVTPEALSADDVASATVMGDLLELARKYDLNKLALRTVDILRRMVTPSTAPLIYEASQHADHHGLQARCVIALKDHIAALVADRQSSLHLISDAARASLLRHFPKTGAEEDMDGHDNAASSTSPQIPEHAAHLHYQPQQTNGSTSDLRYADARHRAPSDAVSAGDGSGAAAPGTRGPLTAFPSPSPSSSSTASSVRTQSRSPLQQDSMFSNPRRPWESNIMNSPIINSPASSRYPSAQSPDMRGSSEAGSGTARDNKRLSSMASPLAYQPLPEESAVTYSSSADAPENTAVGHSHHSPQQNAAYSGSNRTSRYLSSSGGHGSTDSATNERRGSDATIETHQPTASSSRTSIFRPWSKMKKMASSSSGSGNGPSASSGAPPPPVPSSYPPFQS